MFCSKCKDPIDKGKEKVLFGRTYCETCHRKKIADIRLARAAFEWTSSAREEMKDLGIVIH